MSNPTSNFGWQMPTNTDLVTNLPADFEVFGQAVDTSMADLKGGTTGQMLTKATNADMDFVWASPNPGDITGITATSPLTGGGTSGDVTVGIQSASTSQAGAVQLTDSTSSTSTTTAATPNAVKSSYDLAAAAIPKSTVTTAGDVIYATGSGAVTRLGIGTAGQVLTVNGGATAPSWASPATSGFVGAVAYNSAGITVSSSTYTLMTLDSESIDTNGFHSTSSNTGRMTIPTGYAGKYRFSGGAIFGNSTAGTYRSISLYKNGSEVAGLTLGNYPYAAQFFSWVATAAVGDYFEIYVWQNTGTTMTVQVDSNRQFAIQYLGA